MPDKRDDTPDNGHEESAEEFDRLCDQLLVHISEFVKEEQIDDAVLSLLMTRLAVTTRMLAYVVSVDKPSGFGLKLDLDRFRRDVDAVVREGKKEADAFIAQAKEALAQAAEDDDEAE
jgi:hypothetical protein